jgi:hypothetical protein
MSLAGEPDGDWTRAAQALGIALCPVVRFFDPMEGTVDSIRRHLGPPGPGGHPDQHWMNGEREGVAFVVGGRTTNAPAEGLALGGFAAAQAMQQLHSTLWLAEIDPPLWMGLRVCMDRRSLLPGSVIAQDVQQASSFVQAWEPARLQQLWSQRRNDGNDPWDLVTSAFQSGLDVQLDDHGVRFVRHGYALMPQSLAPPLEAITTIAQRLKAARAQMGPAPWEHAAAEAWTELARRHEMELDRDRLRAHAVLESCDVDVRLVSHVQPRTVLRVRFPNPVGLRLQIVPGHASRLPKFLGGQDVATGDRAFDEAFVVHGAPAPRVRETVHAQMRRDLLALAATGARVEVQDDHLEASLPGLCLEAAQLDELLTRGLAVVRGFWHRVEAPGAPKPYR